VDDETLARLRREYGEAGLDEEDAGDDPIALLLRWLADATAAGLHEPNAMMLSTVGQAGTPSARMVLLKAIEPDGLTFFTNYESRKAADLAANPAAALLLPWHPLQRQVRIEGHAVRLSRPRNEAYFAVRPRGAQLGAWASPQSQQVRDREFLEQRYERVAARFPSSAPVPCPPHWGGYRVEPQMLEFWQGRRDRMHDRLRYVRDRGGWSRSRLAP
jgi:pyridoxamine 5'-phosphate oxidase